MEILEIFPTLYWISYGTTLPMSLQWSGMTTAKVNTWKSKSRIEYGTHDDAKHLKESVTDNMPTYGSHTQNGLNVLYFDGNDKLRTSETVAQPGTHHFIAVVANITQVNGIDDSIFEISTGSR